MSRVTKREPMSNVDAAWWRMETPTNLMMVSGVMYFETKIAMDELRAVVEKRLLRFDRFRQRVEDPRATFKAPQWVEDADFDLSWHLQHETLPEPGGREALQKRAGELMSTALDYRRPLWQIHLLENCGSGNAIMTRVHHCIADGMALVGVLLSMTGHTPEESLRLDDPPREDPPLNSDGNLFKMFGSALGAAGRTLSKPGKLIDLTKLAAQTVYTAAKLVAKKPDPKSRFKGELGPVKLAAWSAPLSLEEVKRVKNLTGTTVNDVLLTAMTGALRRYLEDHGDQVDDVSFRAAVPVNLRPPGEITKLGNRFGLVFLSLPVGIADPLERLAALKKNMDALKSSPEAVVALGILKAMGMTPVEIQQIIIKIFGAKSTAVMTNVPGPPEPLYLGGKRIDHQMFWVPRAGRLGLGVSILSYAGTVRLGVAADAKLTPDPNGVIERFHGEFRTLADLAEARANAETPSSEPPAP